MAWARLQPFSVVLESLFLRAPSLGEFMAGIIAWRVSKTGRLTYTWLTRSSDLIHKNRRQHGQDVCDRRRHDPVRQTGRKRPVSRDGRGGGAPGPAGCGPRL